MSTNEQQRNAVVTANLDVGFFVLAAVANGVVVAKHSTLSLDPQQMVLASGIVWAVVCVLRVLVALLRGTDEYD